MNAKRRPRDKELCSDCSKLFSDHTAKMKAFIKEHNDFLDSIGPALPGESQQDRIKRIRIPADKEADLIVLQEKSLAVFNEGEAILSKNDHCEIC